MEISLEWRYFMKKTLRIVVPICMTMLVAASIVWYLFVFDRDFTRDMLLQQARYNDMYGNPRLSAWFYNLAYAQSGKDEDVAIELANQYKGDGNFTKAEVTLSRAINAGATPDLYTALCKTYVEQDKLMDAVALLAGIPDENIRSTLEQQRPTAPKADQTPGFYTQYIKVGLSSSSGTLLYSTNGEYPSIKDTPYTEPITMPSGETVLYCISVDNSGLVSPVTILNYTVGGVIEPVVFMDADMETAVRSLLQKSSGASLFTNHLWEIKEFEVPGEVNSLEDLALMPYLETLTISGRRIESLDCLSSLTKLQTLKLNDCSLSAADLSVLANLPLLTSLTLNNCGISSIASLEGAAGLQYLDIGDNAIRNLDVLSQMTELTELYIAHNAVVKLDAISSLVNLEKLDVSYNLLTTLEPLAECEKLTWLNAANNELEDVDGIAGLPVLTSLALNYNNLQDISDLGGLLQLTELSLADNSISDFASLEALTKLEIFDMSHNETTALPKWPEGSALRIIDCSHNYITSLDVLAGMPDLTYVSADYNQLTDVDCLADCPSLVQVNVYGNNIADISALRDHNIIVNYDPTAG